MCQLILSLIVASLLVQYAFLLLADIGENRLRDQPKVCEPRSWDYFFMLGAIYCSEFHLSKVVFTYTVLV